MNIIKRWDGLMQTRGELYTAGVEGANLRNERSEVGHWEATLPTSLFLKYRKGMMYTFHIILSNKEL